MTPERIEEIIEALRGTPKSLEDVLQEGEDPNDQTLCDSIDNAIFCCRVCEWWCDLGEANESPTGDGDECDDCHEEDD